jgi:hypothetical protein
MAPDGSLPGSQQPTIGPYPKPDESCPRSDNLLVCDSFKKSSPSMTKFLKWSLPFKFSK